MELSKKLILKLTLKKLKNFVSVFFFIVFWRIKNNQNKLNYLLKDIVYRGSLRDPIHDLFFSC